MLRCDRSNTEGRVYCPAYFAGRWPEWCGCVSQPEPKKIKSEMVSTGLAVIVSALIGIAMGIIRRGG